MCFEAKETDLCNLYGAKYSSFLFVKYLFDMYGMDNVMTTFFTNTRFTTAFNVTFEEALADFIEPCAR